MAEKIPGDLGGGSRLSRFEPAFRAASTKRRMAKSGTWLRSRRARSARPSLHRAVRALPGSLPPSGGRPLGGQTSPFAANEPCTRAALRCGGAAVDQPTPEAVGGPCLGDRADPCGADDVGGELRPYLLVRAVARSATTRGGATLEGHALCQNPVRLIQGSGESGQPLASTGLGY